MDFKSVEAIIESSLRKNFDMEIPPGMSYSFGHYMSECRTVTLGLPRGSGKTAMARQYAMKRSSLILCETMAQTDQHATGNAMSYSSFLRYFDMYRGVRTGMKYQCLVLDDMHAPMQPIHCVLQDMHAMNMLTYDFHIVRFETSRTSR